MYFWKSNFYESGILGNDDYAKTWMINNIDKNAIMDKLLKFVILKSTKLYNGNI